MLMRAAAEYNWNLNFGGIALMWRGGCIIRSAFLGKIKEAFDAEPNLTNLLIAPYFREAVAAASRPGGGSSPPPWSWAFRFRPCPAPWLFTMAIVGDVCPPT